MDKSGKKLIFALLTAAAWLGALACTPAIAESLSAPDRPGISISGGKINFSAHREAEAGGPAFSSSRFQPTSLRFRTTTGRVADTIAKDDAPSPSPTPTLSPIPTSTPEVVKTPTPGPTAIPTPSPVPPPWIYPGTLSRVYFPDLDYLFRDPPGKIEVIVTSPDRTRTQRTVLEKTDYSPKKKTLAYPLLMEAYRMVYRQLLGISLITPTQVPTATPTPEGYKTPPPSPTRTPGYCEFPLQVSKLEDMSISQSRSNKLFGWEWDITRAVDPGNRAERYGQTPDNLNTYYFGSEYELQPVALLIYCNQAAVTDIREGDWATLTYYGAAGLQSIKVYPPAVAISPQFASVYYFIAQDGSTYNDRWLCDQAGIIPTPTPLILELDSGDYDGDRTSDIAIFRPASGLWAIRGITRAYFGRINDLPVSGDYNGDGTTDIAVFRESSGLWAVRGQTRLYYGAAGDIQVPGDYNGDGICDPGIFRTSSGLWSIRDFTRAYFGKSVDRPVPGYYQGKGPKNIAVFRPSTGLWAMRGLSRVYFGAGTDWPVPSDYTGDETDDIAIFRPASGLWAVRGVTRAYFGKENDLPVRGDFDGTAAVEVGIFRESSGLWAIRGISRTYFGRAGDLPLGAPPCRPVTPSPTLTPEGYKTPTPTPSSTPSPTPEGYKTPIPSPTPSNSPTPSPSPTPTTSPTPTPGPFDLAGTIEVGLPIWSLWADDSYLYAGTGDSSVYIYERQPPGSFVFQTRLEGSGGENIYGLAGIQSGGLPYRLYGSSSLGLVYAWDYHWNTEKWTQLTAIDLPLNSAMNSLAADNLQIAGAHNNGMVYIWKSSDFSLQTVLDPVTGPVLSASLDAYYFYSGGGDGLLHRWERGDDGASFTVFSAFGLPIWATEVDDYYFYAGDTSPALTAWSKLDDSPLTGEPPPGRIQALSSDQMSYISGVGDEGDLYVWSNADLTLRTTSPGSDQSLYAVFADRYRAGVSYTRYIYGGGADGIIYLWMGERTPTPSPTSSPTPSCTPSPTASPTPSTTPSPTSSPTPVGYKTPSPTLTPTPIPAFSLMTTIEAGGSKIWSLWADHDNLCAGTDEGSIWIWDRNGSGAFNLQTVIIVDLLEQIYGLSGYTVADPQSLYGATSEGIVREWRKNGTWKYYNYEPKTTPPPSMNSVSADGDLICAANDDGGVYVWSAGAFTLQTVLVPAVVPMHSVSLDPYYYIFAGGQDGSVYCWDRGDFSFLTEFVASGEPIYSTEVDDDYLYAGGSAPNLSRWSLTDFSVSTWGNQSVSDLSSDGRQYIAGVGGGDALYVWSTDDFSLQTVSTVASESFHSVFADRHEETPDNPRYIFAGSGNSQIYVWWGDNPSLSGSAPGGGLPKLGKPSPSPIEYSPAPRTPAGTATPTSSPTPIPPVTPVPGPGEGTFDLVGTIEVGPPVWSVWADDRYLYGGTGDGSVYIWERGPGGFYFQGSVGGYTEGNIYGLSGYQGLFQRRLYGASEDGTVYAWDFDLRSGGLALLASLDQGNSFMYSVAADRDLVCGANNDGGIYVWSAVNFSLQTVFNRGAGPALSVSLDGDYIYGGFADGAVFLWDRETLVPANAFSASTDIVWVTAVDGDNFYGGGSSPALAGWSKTDFSLLTGEGGPPGPVAGLTSDWRNYLSGAGPDGALYVWSLADFSLQTVSRASSVPLYSVFADRYRTGDGLPHFIYGGSADGNIYVWRGERTPTPTPTPSLPPTPPPPPSATPPNYRTPSPTATATATPRGLKTPTPAPTPIFIPTPPDRATPPPVPSPTFGTRLILDPTATPTPVTTPSATPPDFTLLTVLEGAEGWMMGVFADREYIYGAGQDNRIHIWDRETYKKVTALTVPECRAMLSVFADGDYIYGGNDDSRVYIWGRKNFGLRYVLGDGHFYVESVYADPDYLYGANYDGEVYLWDRSDFSLQTRLTGPRGWLNTVFADGASIFAGSGGIENTVAIWDRSDLTFSRSLTGPGDDLNSVWVDDDYIYGGCADGYLYLWERDSFRLAKILTQPVNQVTSVVSQGLFIYASSLDHGLYVWDKSGLSLLRVLDEMEQPLQGVYVEGEQIFAAARDGRIYIWQAPSAGLAITPVSGYPHPPVPPSNPDSGMVVKELLSAANEGDEQGGIAWKDGYLYENTGEDNVLYQRDPVDGKLIGGVVGLESSEDLGIAWDPDNALWYIADPRKTGISAFWETAPDPYDLSVPPFGNVTGLFYDPDRRELLSANHPQNYINVWPIDLDDLPRQPERIEVGFPQGGVAVVNDMIWAGHYTDSPYCPVYELDRSGVKTGRQFVLPEGRQARDMTWDGEYLWVRSDYRFGSIKIYQIDIGAASGPEEGIEEDPPLKKILPDPTPEPEEKRTFPALWPTPAVFEWVPPAEPYDPQKKSLDYSLLQETYKKTYWELFDIPLTTPTPPPTPIPTLTPVPTPKDSPSDEKKVVINEIARGDLFSTKKDQWIELYNAGGSRVSFSTESSWKLKNIASSWEVKLDKGSIDKGGYYVLYTGVKPDGKGDQSYSYQMTDGDHLSLINADGKTEDEVNFQFWPEGGSGISMERKDPEEKGSNSSNWASSQLNGWTPGAVNNVSTVAGAERTARVAAASLEKGAGSSGSAPIANISLWEYADWIDFASGRYFKIYQGDRAAAGDQAVFYDYLPNAAFIYLVTGYRPTGLYFKQNLLDLVRDSSFDWGGKEHSRYISDLAESYLAVLSSGLFSEEERSEVREKFYQLALERRNLTGEGHSAQGVICGLNAVAGYLIGGERGREMIEWANRLLSYDDTWTFPENSRHYAGIFLQEMLRVALYSNRMTIPETDRQERAWKRNFARQVQWIIESSPHNGYSPAQGEEFQPNHLGHFMAPLVVATTILNDDDPDHLRLAAEAKWLFQANFNYALRHRVGNYDQNAYGYGSSQWGPFAILFNPVYLYWFLNDNLAAVPPASDSTVLYRPMLKDEADDGVYDKSLSQLITQPDRIVHRSGWGENDLFLALDPAYPAAKSGEDKYSFANNILSLSYGPEEFLTGLTANEESGEKTRANLADILSDYTGAQLVSWVNNSELSRSVTRLNEKGRSWTREVTLYKTGDRRIEVRDTLSRRGSVYWHFSGQPLREENGAVLDVNGTRLSIAWEGAERVSRRNRTTWSDPKPEKRWTYSGPSDHEIKLYRSTPGTIVTIFKGL